MKIDALTICVDYADFLAHCIPHNRHLFHRYVVVTTPHDRRTRDLCEHYYVDCLTSDCFYDDGDVFSKSSGINMALAHLDSRDWVLHLDADIVLPPRTRMILDGLTLDPTCIYGVDRIMCPNHAAWMEYMSAPEVQHSCQTFVQASAFPFGTRVGRLARDGWSPVGYFQLWSPDGSGISRYPRHGAADRSDHVHAMMWPRHKRVLIPEIVAIHLEQQSEATAPSETA